MGESVRFFAGLRVDEPDMQATQLLLHQAFEELGVLFLGQPAGAHGGIVTGLFPGNSLLNPTPYPINAVPFASGWLIDSLRKFTYHDGVTGTVDMTLIANVNNSKVWARRAAAQLDTTVDDRIVIVASAEQQQAVATRQRHVLEFTATTGAAPAGTGWVEILKILTWTTVSGVAVPSSIEQVSMWRNHRTLIALLDAIIGEIAELKGGGINSDTWKNAPVTSIYDLNDYVINTLSATVLALGLSKLDKEHSEEATSDNDGQVLHVKAAALLLSNGSTLSIAAGRGRNVTAINRVDTGKYTLTLNFNGSPAANKASMVFWQFLPNSMAHGVDIHAGLPYTAEVPKCAMTYEAASTTVKIRINRAGSETDLSNNEAILVWVI